MVEGLHKCHALKLWQEPGLSVMEQHVVKMSQGWAVKGAQSTGQKLCTEGSRRRKTDLCFKASADLCSTLPLTVILPTMPGK